MASNLPMAARVFIGSLPTVPLADLNAQDQECSICLGAYIASDAQEEPRRLPCSHVFGTECLALWLVNHNTCPLCRAVLFPQVRRVEPVPMAFNEGIFRDVDTEGLVHNMREFLYRNPPSDREFRPVPNLPERTLRLERLPTGVRATVYSEQQTNEDGHPPERLFTLRDQVSILPREPVQLSIIPPPPVRRMILHYGGEFLYDGSYSLWIEVPGDPAANRPTRVLRSRFSSAEAAARQRATVHARYASERGFDLERWARERGDGANTTMPQQRSGIGAAEQIAGTTSTRTGIGIASSQRNAQSAGSDGQSTFALPGTSSEANRLGSSATHVPSTLQAYQALNVQATTANADIQASGNTARPSVGPSDATPSVPVPSPQYIRPSFSATRSQTHVESASSSTNRIRTREIASAEAQRSTETHMESASSSTSRSESTETTSVQAPRSSETPSDASLDPIRLTYPGTRLPIRMTNPSTNHYRAPLGTLRGTPFNRGTNHTRAPPRASIQSELLARIPPLEASNASWAAYLEGQRTGALQNPFSNLQMADIQAEGEAREDAERSSARSASYIHHLQGHTAEPSTHERRSQVPNDGREYTRFSSTGSTSYPNSQQTFGESSSRPHGNVLRMPTAPVRTPGQHEETRVEPGLRQHLRDVTGRDDVDPRGGVTRGFLGGSSVAPGYGPRFM